MARQTKSDDATDHDAASGAVVRFDDGSTVEFPSVEEARSDFPRGWVMTAEEYAEYQASQADEPDAEPEQANGE